MRENFGTALRLVLGHEGGWSDHPSDPGGATNKGITLATYRGWAKNPRLGKDDLRVITEETVATIYRERYWNAIKGDDLPLGIDFALLDFAVNSGHSRAVKMLQAIVGEDRDGKMGPMTLAALRAYGPRQAIVDLCRERLTFLQGLKTWPVFGNGWGRRVREVEAAALGMVGVGPASAPPVRPAEQITRPPRSVAEPEPEDAIAPAPRPTTGSSGVAVETAGAAAATGLAVTGDAPMWAIAIVVVLAAVLITRRWWLPLFRRKKP